MVQLSVEYAHRSSLRQQKQLRTICRENLLHAENFMEKLI